MKGAAADYSSSRVDRTQTAALNLKSKATAVSGEAGSNKNEEVGIGNLGELRRCEITIRTISASVLSQRSPRRDIKTHFISPWQTKQLAVASTTTNSVINQAHEHIKYLEGNWRGMPSGCWVWRIRSRKTLQAARWQRNHIYYFLNCRLLRVANILIYSKMK